MTQTAPVRIGVAGALGRMGRAIAGLAQDRDGVVLGPRFDRADLAGQTIDGVALVAAGQSATFSVNRQGKALEIKATIGARPDDKVASIAPAGQGAPGATASDTPHRPAVMGSRLVVSVSTQTVPLSRARAIHLSRSLAVVTVT